VAASSSVRSIDSIRLPGHHRPTPLSLWHLLSLDAPTVAALWTWFLASLHHIHLPAASILSMFLAVWMLYATDRLLDARLLDARILDARLLGARSLFQPLESPLCAADPLSTAHLEHRHHFHHRHRPAFLLGILAASAALAALIPRLPTQSVHLYLILGAFIAGYFTLVHATGSAHRIPKEIAVGLFFSAGIFIPTIARAPTLRLALLPTAALIALLCSLNCLFIYRWEHPLSAPLREAPSLIHPVTRAALRYLNPLALALACASAFLIFPGPLPWAISLSALLLLVLDRYPARLHPITLRAAADLALTTPLLFLPHLLKAV